VRGWNGWRGRGIVMEMGWLGMRLEEMADGLAGERAVDGES
jgi:hypothetical protein